MRRSPSIVPQGHDQTVYIVADDFGKIGRAWLETDYEESDIETVIEGILSGEFKNPFRIVAFNTAEGWSRDVTEDIAEEVWTRCSQKDEMPQSVQNFLETVGKL